MVDWRSAPAPLRERLGRVGVWGLRMVLALRDEQPVVLRSYADRIQLHGADPDAAAEWPVDPVMIASSSIEDYLDLLTNAASKRGSVSDHASGEKLIAGACALLRRFAPTDVLADALASVRAMPAGNGPSTLGGVYGRAAIACWLMLHPWVSPNPEGTRMVLLKMILKTEAALAGVPEQEAVLSVSDDDAIQRLTELLVPDDEVLAASVLSRRAQQVLRRHPINPNPDQRSLVELDLIFATKAHMMEHPDRTHDTDGMLLDYIGRCLTPAAARRRQAVVDAVTDRKPRSASGGRGNTKRGRRKKHR